MRLTLLSSEDIRHALPMRQAIEVTKTAFADLSAGRADVPQRMSLAVPPVEGTLLVKPAYVPSSGLGAKLVSVFPRNADRGEPIIHGVVVLIDPATGRPSALCDGGFLTAWRTGAASGAATDLLARSDAASAAILGTGVQARTQLTAICAVRDLQEVRVYSRDAKARERFVAELQPTVEATLLAASSPDGAVRGADIVCAATTSSTPVFADAAVAPGAHINGVGSFTASMQEIDADTVGRARVFVDSREAALAEAGDLLIARDAGKTKPEDWIELGDVAGGQQPGRTSEREITFFKSVGVAVQDIATFAAALKQAEALSLGTAVEL
jgi:ornithine cyclodeaminase/alanine dehydrogenase-like protein (mu-crystallin family)